MPFDPYLHEAVGVGLGADAEPGTVVEVVRPGYGEGDRQLRPAACGRRREARLRRQMAASRTRTTTRYLGTAHRSTEELQRACRHAGPAPPPRCQQGDPDARGAVQGSPTRPITLLARPRRRGSARSRWPEFRNIPEDSSTNERYARGRRRSLALGASGGGSGGGSGFGVALGGSPPPAVARRRALCRSGGPSRRLPRPQRRAARRAQACWVRTRKPSRQLLFEDAASSGAAAAPSMWRRWACEEGQHSARGDGRVADPAGGQGRRPRPCGNVAAL